MNTSQYDLLLLDSMFNAHVGHPIYRNRFNENKTRFNNACCGLSGIFGTNIASAINAMSNRRQGSETNGTQSTNSAGGGASASASSASSVGGGASADSVGGGASANSTGGGASADSVGGGASASSASVSNMTIADIVNSLMSSPYTQVTYTLNNPHNTNNLNSVNNIATLFPMTGGFLSGFVNQNMQDIFTGFISRLINTGSYEDVGAPLSENVFEQLGSGNYKDMKDNLSNSNTRCDTSCVICQEDFKEDDQVTNVKCTNNHIFHTDCIKPWLTQMSKKCPTCREDLAEHSVS
jgi:hypothetical protein